MKGRARARRAIEAHVVKFFFSWNGGRSRESSRSVPHRIRGAAEFSPLSYVFLSCNESGGQPFPLGMKQGRRKGMVVVQ